MRRYHADRHPKLITDDPNRLQQIRVVGDDEGDLAVLPEGVEKKMAGEVNVGALHAAAMEIEAIYVDVCLSHEKAEAAFRQPRAPFPKE